MAQSGSTLSTTGEAKLDRLLKMVEEANALMATWSSAPPSSPTSSASSTPTAAVATATPPSTPARTAMPTPTTTITLGTIDTPTEPTAALTPVVDNDDGDVSEIRIPLSELVSSAFDDHIPDEVTQAPPLDADPLPPPSTYVVDALYRSPADMLATISDFVFTGVVAADQIPNGSSLTSNDFDALLDAGQKFVMPLPCVRLNSDDDHEYSDYDLAPLHRATATRFHIIRPDGIPEEQHHVKMVLPVEEDGVSSTLPNRCLMNCLTIIQHCFSFPFSCCWDVLLCWQHRSWPPPAKFQLVSCETELRPLPWPSFDMVERFVITSLSVHLWKPPWYVSSHQHISHELTGFVELWKCLMQLESIVVVLILLGNCLLDSEVMAASILSKLKLVHHGSCIDSGVSSVHILFHPTTAYQPWCTDPIVIGRNSGASKTYLTTLLMLDGLVILLGFSMVVQLEACTKKNKHTSSNNESISYHWTIIAVSLTLNLIWRTISTGCVELKPWPNWHGHQGSLIVALVCPHSCIMVWIQFKCSVHKLLVWSFHCCQYFTYCLELLSSTRNVDSIKMKTIGLNQLHIANSVREVCCLFTCYHQCLLFTCYHQPVEWKPPWISLVYNTIQRSCSFACSTSMWTPTQIQLFWWPAVTICELCVPLYKQSVSNAVGQCMYLELKHDCEVWGGLLVSVSVSGHLLGAETLLLNIWLVQKCHHSHNAADASFHIYLIGLNAILLFNGCGNNLVSASELYYILMQQYHRWLSLSERRYVGSNSVMLQFLVATCMILSPVNYNNRNNGSVFHQWLIFVPLLELHRLSCFKPRSSSGKLLLVWAKPYVIRISSNMKALFLCNPTQHYGLLYSGRPALLPFASSSLLAWFDTELKHDRIILPGPQTANFVGLQLNLMAFGFTDLHANEADQSYFRGAWEAIYSECFASPFILPMVPVIPFQASTSQHSRILDVMNKTRTGSNMMALQFYSLMIEDP